MPHQPFWKILVNLTLYIYIFFLVNEAQISDDGQWIWLNDDWQYLPDLDVSQYENNADDTAWTGKNFMLMITQKEQKIS